MVEEMEQGERTYEPTRLRLDEARRRGKVVRSHELTTTLVMLGGLGLLALLAPAILNALVKMMGAMLDGCHAQVFAGMSTVLPHARADLGMAPVVGPLLWPLAAMAGAMVALAVVVNLAQVGLPASTEQVKPDWERVSATAGLKRLWSARTLERAAMLLVRLGAVGAITYFTIRAAMPRIAAVAQPPSAVSSLFSMADKTQPGAAVPLAELTEAVSLLWQLAMRLGLALVAIGALDYLYQRWQHRRDLRISHRQLRDDLRQMEGDPNLRNRRRQMAVNRTLMGAGHPWPPPPDAAAKDGRRASGTGMGATLHTTGAGNV